MYQLIPRTWRNVTLTLFALLALYAAGLAEWLAVEISPYRVAAAVTFVVMGVLGLTLGSSRFCSWTWGKFPLLNKLLFPDLNGVWVGTTRSNWPVIKAMMDSAASPESIDLGSLSNIPLQEDGMAILIEANLFKIHVKARAARTNGNSRSITASVDRLPNDLDIRLSYIYDQETPDPVYTDESNHIGAATLFFENGTYDECKGYYWTRRKWREGTNTAGQLSFKRIARKFDPKIHDLLQLAKSTSG